MGAGNRKLSYQDFEGEKYSQFREAPRRKNTGNPFLFETENVEQLNELTAMRRDSNGKSLHFQIQPGAERCLMWTRKVKVLCGMRSTRDRPLENTRMFNFKQFMKLFADVYHQMASGSAGDHDQLGVSSLVKTVMSCDMNVDDMRGWVSVSIQKEITDRLESNSLKATRAAVRQQLRDKDCCCICCDRESDTVLPCTHRYCDQCITQWYASSHHHDCPQCREELVESTDTWHMLSKPPDLTNGDLLSAVFQARASGFNSQARRSMNLSS